MTHRCLFHLVIVRLGQFPDRHFEQCHSRVAKIVKLTHMVAKDEHAEDTESEEDDDEHDREADDIPKGQIEHAPE